MDLWTTLSFVRDFARPGQNSNQYTAATCLLTGQVLLCSCADLPRMFGGALMQGL